MFYLKGEISIVKEFLKYWIGKSDNTLFGLEMAILLECCPTSSHPLSVKLSALFEELRQELNVRTLKVQLQLNLFHYSSPFHKNGRARVTFHVITLLLEIKFNPVYS